MNAHEFFETLDFDTLLKDIEHSLVGSRLPRNFSFDDETVHKYLKDKDYQKYLIPGYEALGVSLIHLFKSGFGYYIMSYVHDYGVNRYSSGFQTKEELFHYANYVVDKGIKAMLSLKDEIYQLKRVEDQMSQEDIVEKNLEYLKTEVKILENIFDMKAKAIYCDRLKDLKTVQTTFNNLIEHYQLIYPIYHTLEKIGALKNVA